MEFEPKYNFDQGWMQRLQRKERLKKRLFNVKLFGALLSSFLLGYLFSLLINS